ncbi:alpha/beta fold hydrolase [Nonomuraea sp. PA05]|uniref:alpha/beta fold hydrolase n=1 Tax=Nonomuraea sp. PA05 TaxID=2604466 RepID=UPI001CA37599|nr:hypothetical protein [Nonomuraea sp. PA05]
MDQHDAGRHTALAVIDTGGPGIPVVHLNGAYADLGSDYRHITHDERARGRSKRSTDYSFEACIRDLDAVLQRRGVDRPILAGWCRRGADPRAVPPHALVLPYRRPAGPGGADEC